MPSRIRVRRTLRPSLYALLAALFPALSACHAPTPVAQAPLSAVAPAPAAACVAPGEFAESFVIDWPSERRGDLEIALKRKVVVVAATCSSVRILPDCTAEAAYPYVGTTEREELVSLPTADDVRANLPLSASTLTGPAGVDFQHGASLDIGLATVGRRTASRATVLRSDLKGECDGATHFVRNVTLGAFAMGPGAAGQAKTVADVFGRGSGSRAQLAKDGALDACRAGKSDGATEVAQCGAPVRVQLKAIREPGSAPPKAAEAAPTCPAGMVFNDLGACERPTSDRPHLCAYSDIPDCTLQCAHGSAMSCAFLGRSYQLGRGVPQDLGRAAELLDKACSGGASVACGRVGEMALASHDEAKGLRLLGRACAAGWVDGCRIAGNYAVKNPSVKGIDVIALFQRACFGGDAEGCWSLGAVYRDGAAGFAKNDVEAARWMSLACDGDANVGCSDYATLVDTGRGEPADPARAVSLLVAACDGGRATACADLANDYILGHSVTRDMAKGVALLERGCGYGNAGVCFLAGRKYQLGAGVPADAAKATLLLTKACEGGIALGCKAAASTP